MKPIIVAGMHRSGTSGVARLVGELGLALGTNLLPATDGNTYGHFEDTGFVSFHDGLIARHFPRRAPFCEWLPLAGREVSYSNADRAGAKSLWAVHRATGGNAWKDPRTSLFLDLWTETLPEAKVIVCLRHPYQVHNSLLRRGEPFLHVDYGAAIAGWTVYNQRILRALSTLVPERFLILDVEEAFQAPERLAENVARFLDVPSSRATAASRAIAADAFHFEEDLQAALRDFERYLPEAGALYRKLKQLDRLAREASAAPAALPSPILSDEARLIEFEEVHGLRSRAKKMLVRSISVDRQRTLDLYDKAIRAGLEKDRLIADLSRLNDCLKRRVAEVQKSSMALAAA